MTERLADYAPVEIRCLTPFYNFSSDTPELAISEGIRISRYDRHDSTDQVDEVAGSYLQICDPDYLLWHDPILSGDVSVEEFSRLIKENKSAELTEALLASTAKLLRAFRLFKPGRLLAGESFIVYRSDADEVGNWSTLSIGRTSTSSIDYSRIAVQATSYELTSIELPFLLAFKETVQHSLRFADSLPALKLALNLYSADNGEELNAVSTVTALEALLTKKEETEGLTYRLSMRVANLLGRDAEARKQIFLEIKSFYNLRSKLVHGAPLDGKLLNQLNELDSLRETLRRVLLSAIALLSEKNSANLPDLLDELAFDDDKRKQVQERAARFFHISNAEQSPEILLKSKLN
jgi:hypothetical protein